MLGPGRVFRSNGSKAILLVLLSILLVSCETVGYYSQAARGQLTIVFGREDIQRLMEREDLPAELAEKFALVMDIREFAEQELGLPVGRNYSSYVDVQREHVVWNVFAAPEFSVDPVNWCYPIAGCVAYRGYFSEQSAQRYSAKLEREGFDVYTGGVDAYSTLGWFEDSLLSTALDRSDYQLAGLVFHELAHQLVYVAGDTTFNESFATAVEREGVRRWLAESNQASYIDSALLEYQRQQQFVDLVTDYRDRLEALYEQDIEDAVMRSRKLELQRGLREDYAVLKRQWQGYAGYDGWFSRALNNAQLSTVASYNDLLPFFESLFVRSNSDFSAFYTEVGRIAELPEFERAELIAQFEEEVQRSGL